MQYKEPITRKIYESNTSFNPSQKTCMNPRIITVGALETKIEPHPLCITAY